MPKAIYYPYIKVPDSPWFTRTLLYWDSVGAIVPYEYIENPERLGHHMAALVREKLVTQVVPAMHLSKVPGFDAAFLDHVDAMTARQSAPSNLWPKVHIEKLQQVAEGLCQRGLARQDKSKKYSPWYNVEPQIAEEFMAYLAAVLGQIPGEDKFVPVTDQINHLQQFRVPAPSVVRRPSIRELVLPRLLPSPSDAVDAASLAEFKENHGAELLDFRREIEFHIAEWARIESDAERELAIQEGLDLLAGRVRQVSEKMEQARWPRLDFGGLCTIVGSGLAVCGAVTTGDFVFGLPGAGLSLASAVFQAFGGSDSNEAGCPLAYAVLAEHQFS